MRKTFIAAMLSASAALLSAQTFAQTVADPVKRILPQGKDGDYYYYQVVCKNGTQGSVVVQDKEKNICSQASGGERVCTAGWNLQKAAQNACR
ncbi:MAG: hypothetical protein BMS9Abin01_2855 [Gammaproteobacteria bacterium]|nr:MAG: hypothetical protein BMS9Abin01_2855 [Gammaproteobacteria bacterium]